MIDAALYALMMDLIRRDAIDPEQLRADLIARGEQEAADFVATCAVEAELPVQPNPDGRGARLRLVTDGGNSA